MVNLSTVYAISIILASMAGMGSAFVGHKFYPIKGGAAIPPPSPAEVYAEAQKTAELAKKLASAQIPPASGPPAENMYTLSTTLTQDTIRKFSYLVGRPIIIPFIDSKVVNLDVLEKSDTLPSDAKRVSISRKMNGSFEFNAKLKEGERVYFVMPTGLRAVVSFVDKSTLSPTQLEQLASVDTSTVPTFNAIPVPIAPLAEPQPDIPEKEEEIPAKAPTDTNNEPSQIPTYLSTPEEPEPQSAEEKEDNPKGGALGLQERIEQEFGMNEDFATNVMLFITTPVEDWAQIASTQDELFQKFKDTLTDTQLGTCPENLKDICKIVVVKYTNMEKFINGKEYVPYGDQTEEASRLLSSTA